MRAALFANFAQDHRRLMQPYYDRLATERIGEFGIGAFLKQVAYKIGLACLDCYVESRQAFVRGWSAGNTHGVLSLIHI